MDILPHLSSLSFWSLLNNQFKEALTGLSEEVILSEGEDVTIQYDLGTNFFLLLDGSVDFYIKIENENEGLKVGSSSNKFTPIGWSGFREPYRYATTVRCKKKSKLVKWRHEDLRSLFQKHPSCAIHFLEYVVFQSQLMLQEIRKYLAEVSVENKSNFLDLVPFQAHSQEVNVDSLETMKKSPFFEVFTEDELLAMHGHSFQKYYQRGEKIYRQNDTTATFDLLLNGKVGLVYSKPEEEFKLDKTIVDNEGYIIGSGCFSHDGVNHVNCVALSASQTLHFDLEEIKSYLTEHPETGVKFYLRLLWFISTRLRSSRVKLIKVNYDGEISAVKNLIEQNCTQLDVTSNLHKIPHLLKSTFTLNMAIDLLENIVTDGSPLERRLSRNSLKLLSEVIKENDFYTGLSTIYSKIVNAPENLTHREVRNICAEEFQEVFRNANYVLKGEENLPEEASIFIYNHLENHVYNTLPNNFQITLDSHFISSVVLYNKYKDPGIRVVRVPRGDEYGHQLYYQRQGHIPVYTKESAPLIETEQEKKERRLQFYQLASEYLQKGTSILLAPEGQSFSTNNSPGEFKPGAFYLSTKMEKEPFIVPIATANFDKRLNSTTFAAVIKKPFKLSEKIEDTSNRKELADFLVKYQKEYKTYVEEAIELSRGNQWLEILK